MNHLRQTAARERRAPIYWWLMVMLATGTALVLMAHGHSRQAAAFLAVMLAAAWAAPLIALQSLASPRRAKAPPPGPGTGTFDDWKKQAHLLGRLLLYYGDNPDLPPEVRQALRAAREDLRDTLKAHPLRDDLERVCGRIRSGAVQQVKEWLWREHGPRVQEIVREYEHLVADGRDEDARILALQTAMETSAVLMTRCAMPRMLERERLACALDCAWLAATAAVQQASRLSPVELSAMLVIEWSDFSEPWRPGLAVRRVFGRLQPEPASEPARAIAAPPPEPESAPTEAPPSPVAPPAAADNMVIRNGKRYRRVRVKRKRKRNRRNRGPSLVDVFISFGQWVRYSVRAWTLYR
ncbi:MAG TPA: hypothetical protein DCM68_03845 [Verrucomicrobia bacterium]|nr:hypothetical protein [Verrucomicrobiota bacterium]